MPIPFIAASVVGLAAAIVLKGASYGANYMRLKHSNPQSVEDFLRTHVLDEEGNVRQDRLDFAVAGTTVRLTPLSMPGEYHILVSSSETGRREFRYSSLNDRFWAT